MPQAPGGTSPDVRSNPTATGLTPATHTGSGRTGPVTSGSFALNSGVHAHVTGAYHPYQQQSALMKLMGPFIEDPRPRWLLATYFLVGVGLGVGAAFGLWGR